MNRAFLIGQLTRDPELRVLTSGQSDTRFTLATTDNDTTEYHAIVVKGRLAEIAATFLARNQEVFVEGRIETRNWIDDRMHRHWKTEIIAADIEPLGGRTRKDMVEHLAAMRQAVTA